MMKGTEKRFGQAFSFKKRPKHGESFKKRKAKVLKKIQITENEIYELQQRIESGIEPSKVETFADFPLSKNTLDGLKKANYIRPTEIQKQAISLALQGKDVLGAAKTGSGKTLAFLIPIMELLHKCKTTSFFGMVALIITPTRELAFQISEVLSKIRIFHDFTANVVIGGKRMRREENLMAHTNIVVCTVGRLLHHLEQTAAFNADELKILVLDEADRIMDSKFAKDMDHIIASLPAQRQTLMFSATQTRSVKDLARLSLKDPSYVSVDEHADYITPSGLEQSYIVCELHEKLSMLLSFLKNHTHSKIIVFLQTCKQVRYVHAVMKRERPGMTVLELHGGLNQLRRFEIYSEFCRKQHVILFSTDLACRGLDFPAVNWVVQLDCPVDVNTYIHRVGRTARFEQNGQALLVLLPSEETDMVQALQQRKIPIKKISVNPQKFQDITGSLSVACTSCQELKDMAERAFRTYVFSIHIMKNKKIFDVNKLDLTKFAESLGLNLKPKLRFLEKKKKKKEEEEESEGAGAMLIPKSDGEKEEEEEEEEEMRPGETGKGLVKAVAASRLLKKGIKANTHVTFDEEGIPVHNINRRKRQHVEEEEEEEEDFLDLDMAVEAKRLRTEDVTDMEFDRKRIKEKHRVERIKRKERKRQTQQQRRAAEGEEEDGVVLDAEDGDDPFQYIPDPDKLPARSSDGSHEDASSDNGEDDEEEEEEDDSNSDNEESEDDNSDDDSDSDDQEKQRSLEDAAVRLLKSSRLKA